MDEEVYLYYDEDDYLVAIEDEDGVHDLEDDE